MHRMFFGDIQELFDAYPQAKAFFNCTGLGSYHLKGVEDKLLYPTRVRIFSMSSMNVFLLTRSRAR